MKKLLIINTGGTSTKIAIFHDENPVIIDTIRHDLSALAQPSSIWDQFAMRKKVVLDYLESQSINLAELDGIVSRGPAVKPLVSGVYHINQQMIDDAKSRLYGDHPSAIGCQIAFDLANSTLPAFTVDPPCVDEMIDVARITGLPDIKRKSFFQALNHKAVGRSVAAQLGKTYHEVNLIISHLGSGVSVATHAKGKVIDVTNGLDGDAPFGLDRVGTLPAADWMRYCLSERHSKEALHQILNGGGGMMAHLGINNAIEIEKRIQEGDTHAELIYRAMAFQVAKGLGAAASALGEKPDGMVLTGGLANSAYFTGMVRERVEWMAPFYVYAGEDEMLALAQGGVRVLNNEEDVRIYS